MTKHKFILLFALGIITISCPVRAQGRVIAELGAGASINATRSGVFSNWADGWSVGAGLLHPISPSLDIGLSLNYLRYAFQGRNLGFPPLNKLSYSYSSVTGAEQSQAAQALVSLRYTPLKFLVQPFASIAAGISWLSIGRINAVSWSGTATWEVPFVVQGSGVTKFEPIAALSAGFVLPLSAVFSINVQGEFAHSLGQAETTVPIVATAQFTL